MRWTDMDESEMIKAWSLEENFDTALDKYLPQPDENMESYWVKFDNEKNIMEYDFETVPELSDLLKRELTDGFFDDLILPLTVAAFKEKAKLEQARTENETGKYEEKNDSFTIPEFVYVFQEKMSVMKEKDKDMVLFGCDSMGYEVLKMLSDENVLCFCDNNKSLQGILRW